MITKEKQVVANDPILEYYSQNQVLKIEGWTNGLVKDLLPNPVRLRNPVYKNGHKMKLYPRADVYAAMKTQAFLEAAGVIERVDTFIVPVHLSEKDVPPLDDLDSIAEMPDELNNINEVTKNVQFKVNIPTARRILILAGENCDMIQNASDTEIFDDIMRLLGGFGITFESTVLS